MAQLDRFLNILVSNNATALILSEGDVATVTIKDSARPVMKQALTSAQILTLVREIAPSEKPHSLDAQGSVRFEYTTADGTFEVALTQNGKISARIEPKSGATAGARSAANGSQLRTEAPKVEAPKVEIPKMEPAKAEPAFAPAPQQASKPEAPRAAITNDRALNRIEDLLKILIAKKASDLH